jgi:hypothetical protein
LFNFPVMWMLFKLRSGMHYIKNENKQILHITVTMLMIGIVIIVSSVLAAGILCRYTVDFSWTFIVPSFICAYFLYRHHVDLNDGKDIPLLKIMYIFCCISIIIGMFLLVNGPSVHGNSILTPVYLYLKQTFSIV